jgi:hypothetical protein
MLNLDIKIYLAVLICASALGIWLFRGLTVAWKLLVAILFCTAVVELIGHLVKWEVDLINLIYLIYTPVSFGLYILVFRFLFTELINQRIAVLAFICMLLAGIGLPLMNRIHDFPSLSIAACSLILIVTSLIMFRELLRTPEQLAISRNPRFLLSAAVLIYWGLFFFRHGLYNTLVREQNGYTIWLDDLHLWISVVYYITLALCVVISYIGRKSAQH